jgi:hypothetical protein
MTAQWRFGVSRNSDWALTAASGQSRRFDCESAWGPGADQRHKRLIDSDSVGRVTIGRLFTNRCGPSRRRVSDAPAGLKNFAHELEGTFSTISAPSGRWPTPKSINANSCHSILAAHVHCRFASVAPDVLRLAMVCLEPPITSFRLDQAVHPGWGT